VINLTAKEEQTPKQELNRTNLEQYTYKYILRVIKEGSNKLHFSKEEMEGGYIPNDIAPRVACYVLELGGHKCPHPYPKDASIYFSSVCASCHGRDGKGINGAYPDLTKSVLLGVKRELNP